MEDADRPVGPPLPGWTARPALDPVELVGRYVGLEPLHPKHSDALYDATCRSDRIGEWTYVSEEMPATRADFAAYVERRVAAPGMSTLAVVPRGGEAAGMASWLRVDAGNGTAEVGGILLGPPLQRTTAATEAMYLMARHVFGLGYRRYEWKCDALNAPSRAAALRLGFSYEGTFRRAMVYKGRSRDTAWFAMTDSDWQILAPAYTRWLASGNFVDPSTGSGQRTSLSELTSSTLAATRYGTPFPHVGTRETLA